MSVLYHFSEDPSITVFFPRPHPSHPALAPAVWAIDAKRAPRFDDPDEKCQELSANKQAALPESGLPVCLFNDYSLIGVFACSRLHFSTSHTCVTQSS